MPFKMKPDVQTVSAEAATPGTERTKERIVLDKYADDQAWAEDDIAAMEELEDMERLARAQLAEQAEALRLPKGAYIHYVPQFYLH